MQNHIPRNPRHSFPQDHRSGHLSLTSHKSTATSPPRVEGPAHDEKTPRTPPALLPGDTLRFVARKLQHAWMLGGKESDSGREKKSAEHAETTRPERGLQWAVERISSAFHAGIYLPILREQGGSFEVLERSEAIGGDAMLLRWRSCRSMALYLRGSRLERAWSRAYTRIFETFARVRNR